MHLWSVASEDSKQHCIIYLILLKMQNLICNFGDHSPLMYQLHANSISCGFDISVQLILHIGGVGLKLILCAV
jgi:hypothetical protein